MAEKKNYWAASIAFLLLFVLPAGSFLYLKKGFKYRKTSLDEMTVMDSLDWSQYTTLHGLGQRDSLSHKIVIATRIGSGPELDGKAWVIDRLHQQFGTRQEIKFALAIPGKEGAWHFTDRDKLDDLYLITEYTDAEIKSDRLALVDPNGRVRGYYNPNDKDDMQKMVRHIAVLLPLEKKAKLDLIRKSN